MVGGATSISTASRITLVKDSAISEILLGCKGRPGSLEVIRATTRRSKLLPVERLDLVFRTYASVGGNTTAKVDHRVYDVMV